MREEVLEGDEGPGERVEFVDGGVDVVDTRATLPHLLAVGHDQEVPAVHLEALPVCGSKRLQRRRENPPSGQTSQLQSEGGTDEKLSSKLLLAPLPPPLPPLPPSAPAA